MFLGRDRAAVSVDVDAERCWPRYHETSVALESTDSRCTSRADDDDVIYYIRERLKLEGETENNGV